MDSQGIEKAKFNHVKWICINLGVANPYENLPTLELSFSDPYIVLSVFIFVVMFRFSGIAFLISDSCSSMPSAAV